MAKVVLKQSSRTDFRGAQKCQSAKRMLVCAITRQICKVVKKQNLKKNKITRIELENDRKNSENVSFPSFNIRKQNRKIWSELWFNYLSVYEYLKRMVFVSLYKLVISKNLTTHTNMSIMSQWKYLRQNVFSDKIEHTQMLKTSTAKDIVLNVKVLK